MRPVEVVKTFPSRHTVSAIDITSVASRRSGAPHPLSSSLALAELQLAEASILSLRASLVSQPSLILQFAGQNYPSWWTTCRGLLQLLATSSDAATPPRLRWPIHTLLAVMRTRVRSTNCEGIHSFLSPICPPYTPLKSKRLSQLRLSL